MINKGNFALAYDRTICLVDGDYEIIWIDTYKDSAGQLRGSITLNSVANATTNMISRSGTEDGSNWESGTNYANIHLKRGDYLVFWGGNWGDTQSRAVMSIKKLN